MVTPSPNEIKAAVYVYKLIQTDPVTRARISLILQAYDAAAARARGEG
jgi:hypothetical protein